VFPANKRSAELSHLFHFTKSDLSFWGGHQLRAVMGKKKKKGKKTPAGADNDASVMSAPSDVEEDPAAFDEVSLEDPSPPASHPEPAEAFEERGNAEPSLSFSEVSLEDAAPPEADASDVGAGRGRVAEPGPATTPADAAGEVAAAPEAAPVPVEAAVAAAEPEVRRKEKASAAVAAAQKPGSSAASPTKAVIIEDTQKARSRSWKEAQDAASVARVVKEAEAAAALAAAQKAADAERDRKAAEKAAKYKAYEAAMAAATEALAAERAAAEASARNALSMAAAVAARNQRASPSVERNLPGASSASSSRSTSAARAEAPDGGGAGGYRAAGAGKGKVSEDEDEAPLDDVDLAKSFHGAGPPPTALDAKKKPKGKRLLGGPGLGEGLRYADDGEDSASPDEGFCSTDRACVVS